MKSDTSQFTKLGEARNQFQFNSDYWLRLLLYKCQINCGWITNFQVVNLHFLPEPIPDHPYVTGVDIHITEKYLNGTYNSCSQVIVPSTGQLALDLMCGDWGASRCSAKKWFTYMGDASTNSYVPFQITYLASPDTKPVDGYIPLDPRVVPCSEAVDVSNIVVITIISSNSIMVLIYRIIR